MLKLLEKLANDFRHLGLGGLSEFYKFYSDYDYERVHRQKTLADVQRTGNQYLLLDTTWPPIGPITNETVAETKRIYGSGRFRADVRVAMGLIYTDAETKALRDKADNLP